MADSKNQGQFGNREDTKQQASEGGKASSGSFQKGSERARKAGKKGGSNS